MAVGRSHEISGIACQDRVRCSRGKSVSVIALADGAGSASLAEQGATVAVSTTVRILRTRFRALIELDDKECARQVVQIVLKDLERHAARAEVLPRLCSHIAI